VGDSRGTLFRVRFGFARGVTTPPAPLLPVLLLAAAAALFLRGFAIILRVRRERERDGGEGRGGWPTMVASGGGRFKDAQGERLRWERIGDGAAKLVDVWRAGQMPNEQRRKEERRERQAGLSLSLSQNSLLRSISLAGEERPLLVP